jgi:hypothetical protein
MGFRLSKLYTRTGDEGKTGLLTCKFSTYQHFAQSWHRFNIDYSISEANWRYRDTTSLESQT